jgi:hypothetical protein
LVAVQRTHLLDHDRRWVPAAARLGRLVLGRTLPRLAGRETTLAEVTARAEGSLVLVRGTIAVAEPLRGVLVDADGVYRRMVFDLGVFGGRWVHEAATDFALVGPRGERVLVHGGGARWLVLPREPLEYPAVRLDRDGVAADVRERVRASGRATIDAFEQVLEPGTLVQVVGYKTTSPDASGDVTDYRSPPQRATLRSGPERPLVITRVSDLD